MKLTNLQIEKIEEFVGQGKSVNRISDMLSIKKTTAYYHFRKMKGKTINKPKIKFNSHCDLGEVVGIFTGDGSFYFETKRYHYQIRVHFGIKNINYLYHVKELFEKSFGKNFIIKKDGQRKIVIQTYSKDIATFFSKFLHFDSSIKSKTVYLKSIFFLKDDEFIKGFLRGLIDTDGTIAKTKTGTKIAFYTSSTKLAQQISDSLNLLEIKNGISTSKNRPDQYNIYVFKRDNDKIIKALNPFKGR